MQEQKETVLFLITKSNWGGAQRYVYDLVTHLDRTQYEIVVAAGGNGTLIEQLTHSGIRTIQIDSLSRDMSLKKEWYFAKDLWTILQQEKPTVLHVNSSKAGGVGCLLGRLARVPRVIFTAHGWAFNEDRPWWQKPVIKLLHYFTVLLSHKTIAVSRAMVTQMNWPFVRNKIQVIHPGRTIGVMYGKKEARAKIIDFCPRLHPYTQDPWLITIGELHPIKRHRILLEAVSTLRNTHPNLRTVIIGDGELRTTLEEQVMHHQLQKHVFFTGSIIEAARFLRAADVFVLSSKSESYGYVLHEAGLANVPVVATNVGGIPDIIINDVSGRLVPPDDSQALANAISQTLTDTGSTRQYQEKLYTSMRSRSVETMTEATTKLYSSTKIDPT